MKKALLVASVLFVALGSALAAAGAGDSPLSIDQVRQLAGSDHWAVYKNNPVLTLGPPGTWDAGALGSMTLARVGNLYHMYYEAWGRMTKSRVHADYISLQIGHATSPDGVHWTKDPANPVLKKGHRQRLGRGRHLASLRSLRGRRVQDVVRRRCGCVQLGLRGLARRQPL